jgi:MoxR-like ATPase
VKEVALHVQVIPVVQAQVPPIALKLPPVVPRLPPIANRLQSSFYKPPAVLEDVLNTLQAENKHHVFLSGAPGIGKSAMAAAVYARCMKVRTSLSR